MLDTTGADAHAEAIRKEYSQFVAKDVIYVGNARAFSPGDPVPASSVESGAISRDLVVGASTKAAAAAVEKG